MDPDDNQRRIPLVEERLEVGKIPVETGRVRVSSRVEEEEQRIHEILASTKVRVERRPVDNLSDERPVMREEADRVVLPVYEEVIVRRFRIAEEIHLIIDRDQTTFDETVTLRRNRVEVEREQ